MPPTRSVSLFATVNTRRIRLIRGSPGSTGLARLRRFDAPLACSPRECMTSGTRFSLATIPVLRGSRLTLRYPCRALSAVKMSATNPSNASRSTCRFDFPRCRNSWNPDGGTLSSPQAFPTVSGASSSRCSVRYRHLTYGPTGGRPGIFSTARSPSRAPQPVLVVSRSHDPY